MKQALAVVAALFAVIVTTATQCDSQSTGSTPLPVLAQDPLFASISLTATQAVKVDSIRSRHSITAHIVQDSVRAVFDSLVQAREHADSSTASTLAGEVQACESGLSAILKDERSALRLVLEPGQQPTFDANAASQDAMTGGTGVQP